MNDILDAAALRSARVVLAVSRTPFVGRVRSRAAVVRAVVETTRDLVEPRVRERLREMGDSAATFRSGGSSAAPDGTARSGSRHDSDPSIVGHGPLALAPDGPPRPGDDERCTCGSRSRPGSPSEWCGATKRDVVYDLMTHGSRLTREQAEHIWDVAQASRTSSA